VLDKGPEISHLRRVETNIDKSINHVRGKIQGVYPYKNSQINPDDPTFFTFPWLLYYYDKPVIPFVPEFTHKIYFGGKNTPPCPSCGSSKNVKCNGWNKFS
jgi:hypothetical protein